jgi:DNA polymerase-3 subunit chi
MTQIDFYTHVEDKLRVACRLAAKAYAQGLRVAVICPDSETAQRVDRQLWTTPATGFIPHCAPDDPLAGETPVTIDAFGTEPAHDEVLINLRPECPPYFGRFRRLVEIVGLADPDCAAARERYRFYRDRGYPIRTHDLSRNSA